MGRMLDLSCTCGYTASVVEGEMDLGETRLRRCKDCEEIVSVITEVNDDADAPVARLDDLRIMQGRCPNCRGTHITTPGGRFRNKDEVHCPRCHQQLSEHLRGIVA